MYPTIYVPLKHESNSNLTDYLIYMNVPGPISENYTVGPLLEGVMSKGAYLANGHCKNHIFWWRFKKGQLKKVQEAIIKEYGGCYVTREYNTSQMCTTSCQNAKKEECVCVCLGQFHSHGESLEHSWKNVVGDLLVSSNRHRVTRQYARNNG